MKIEDVGSVRQISMCQADSGGQNDYGSEVTSNRTKILLLLVIPRTMSFGKEVDAVQVVSNTPNSEPAYLPKSFISFAR